MLLEGILGIGIESDLNGILDLRFHFLSLAGGTAQRAADPPPVKCKTSAKSIGNQCTRSGTAFEDSVETNVAIPTFGRLIQSQREQNGEFLDEDTCRWRYEECRQRQIVEGKRQRKVCRTRE